ncbi:GNAT family protein [Luedemannella flava]|uniref:GNAT family N-acetyltransferase n=1 Tax=Luedemannella flava TaxID=349316 RepID=UPI0031D5C3CC
MYPVRIEGGRIVLREFAEHDLDASMAVVGDPDVTVHLSFDTRSPDQQALRLAADIDRARCEPRPDYYLAIADRRTDELVGFVRIGLGGHRSGELGYAVRRDRWRQGYALEAARLMLAFGFDTLGLHRIQAACGPDNVASRALLEKLGFSYEGRMRDHVFTNDAWRDSLLYAKLCR